MSAICVRSFIFNETSCIKQPARQSSARVDFGGGLENRHMPWMTQRVAENHSWRPLETGERVRVGALSGDLAKAVLPGAIPRTARLAPSG
ncbi:hypothetical protein ETW24_08045 [Leisingera sp. NJS204]|nr:hypothetical protein ETW24_08045 [Leisingera sp. NJS204]